MPRAKKLPKDIEAYFEKCRAIIGFVPNVLNGYLFDLARLRNFIESYTATMDRDGELSKLERELIAVVVSASNACYYCLVSHGQAVRELSGSPELGEQLVMNYRTARLTRRQRAMLDFSVKLTEEPHQVTELDRQRLRRAGFSDVAIWEVSEITAFFNMTNRMAIGVDMQPNSEYHSRNR
jgi:uncharacterized peroxidase-related enzyme